MADVRFYKIAGKLVFTSGKPFLFLIGCPKRQTTQYNRLKLDDVQWCLSHFFNSINLPIYKKQIQ